MFTIKILKTCFAPDESVKVSGPKISILLAGAGAEGAENIDRPGGIILQVFSLLCNYKE